ncbi:MAG: hypothetical protein INF79_07375 [Roseomonas sp.]|nr:hypothetical protein [Roseomonas sp.]MCA3327481.1 hypothetical protein [Roseomonas sp.]MCA3331059.1 hypothetical protein [Roseomonas sp.]MCA3334943.1 hypothetical protein [Roseomonas sp.]MCA3345952.1 hypothetical protein [Roseomonas sp.]
MSEKRPTIIIDMTPEGEFRDPPPPPAPPARYGFDLIIARIGGAAMLLALATGGLVLAALALLAIGVLLPIVLAAGAIGAVSLWWRLRQARARGKAATIITRIDRRV